MPSNEIIEFLRQAGRKGGRANSPAQRKSRLTKSLPAMLAARRGKLKKNPK